MSDPRRQPVIKTQSKKSKVAERTLAERKFCEIDQFYYSEMFTCPICYGVEREQERIIKLLKPLAQHSELCKDGCYPEDCSAPSYEFAIHLIEGKQDEI